MDINKTHEEVKKAEEALLKARQNELDETKKAAKKSRREYIKLIIITLHHMNQYHSIMYTFFRNRSVQVTVGTIALLAMTTPFITHGSMLTTQMDLGARGTNVTSLQTFLALDNSIYPQGLITGYFGTLTASAVSNFQARNGLAAVGRVGPATLALINNQMVSGGMSGAGMNGGTVDGYGRTGDISAPTISNIVINTSNNGATISWNTNEMAKGMIYYSTTMLTTYENPHTVDVSGSSVMTDSALRTAQSVSLNSSLQSNTTYYYLIYVTDAYGNVSITLPATFQTTS